MNVEALVIALEAMVLAIATGEFGDSVGFEQAAKNTRTFAREWVSGYQYTWVNDDSECGGGYRKSEWYQRIHDAMAKLEQAESDRYDRIEWAFSEEGDGEIAF